MQAMFFLAGEYSRRARGRATAAVVISAVVMGLAACGSSTEPAVEGGTGQQNPAAPGQQQRAMMDLEQQVEFAHKDLAAHLGVDRDDLRLLEAAAVRWRDSSMRRPLPIRGYTQVITPGVLIRFAHGKTVYEYHGGRTGRPFLCAPPATIQRPAAGSPRVGATMTDLSGV